MYNFFSENDKINGRYEITGNDFNHVKNVLRMKVGDEFLVSFNGKSDLCAIESFSQSSVTVAVVRENYNDTNLPINLVLLQGLPKSDKMELIIQKAVELGADRIVPVQTARSVVKLLGKKDNKTSRWQAIAESGAKQSKRNSIPKVDEVLSFKQALDLAKTFDLFLVPYENHDGMTATKNALSEIKKGMTVGILIGPEGGFEQSEIDLCESINAKTISLGKRILRAETASITALSMVMLHAEMNLD